MNDPTSIKDLYENGTPGETYTILGKVFGITPKKASTGSIRIAYKLNDGSGKIDCVIFTDEQIKGVYIDTEVIITGEFKELQPRAGYERGYRFLDIKNKEDIVEKTGELPTRTEQHTAEKKATDDFNAAVQNIHETITTEPLPPAPEVGVDFSKYLAKDFVIARLKQLIDEVSRQ